MPDTIAAIATATGAGGIAIVRISGDRAQEISRAVFRPAGRARLAHGKMTYGKAVDEGGSAIDEAMAVLFKAPRSYTREDVLEIHCHGGGEMARLILSACVKAGARLAQPGEFTKRAFLNGRIDLAQAEAVMRIIAAKSEKAARQSRAQLEGALSRRIDALQEQLLNMMAAIEAAADYPEENLEETTAAQTARGIRALLSELEGLIAGAAYARRVADGLRVCIAGKPNAGKSSLLNALLGENRAIVTDIAGTTRDVLTEPLTLNGIPLILSDTAGLRTDGGFIEQIGIRRAREEIDRADIVLLVWDMGEPFTREDSALLRLDKPVILVRNKADVAAGEKSVPRHPLSVTISALTGQGVGALKGLMAGIAERDAAAGEANLTEQRHIEAARDAVKSLTLALEGIEMRVPIDLCAIDLTAAWEALGLITGKTANEELITRIFESFCLGK